MTALPQPYAQRRAERVRLSAVTPAVLRLEDGRRTPGKLEIVSLTGGLLWLSRPLSQGCQVKLMFVTQSGPVLGAAEMLSPVNGRLQPFRFMSLHADDRNRLGAAIDSCLHPNQGSRSQAATAREPIAHRPAPALNEQVAPQPNEQEWIHKYRAALVHKKPKRRILPFLLAFITLGTLGLSSAFYLLQSYRPR
jgi:hypothetical protein